jgi:two-component system, OmpR family, sensor histidine kinase SenX3
MTLRRDPTKGLQIGFLALLAISTAQVGYWIAEEVLYTRSVSERFETLYRDDAAAVTALYAGGAPASEIERALPHLVIDPATQRASARPEAIAALEREGSRRTTRYLWEGGFFLAVLIGGMAVLTRTIRHDAELRRRQQNFLAAVSHEFKSPLASVRLAAETLVLRSAEPDSRRLGERILGDGERLLRMVDNLLETSRLEEGRQSMTARGVKLKPAVEAGVAEIAERARLGNISVSVDVPEALTLAADPQALESVLRNLLDNAVKACSAGDGHAISVAAQTRGERAEIAVSDDGVGFPPEDAAMIFEKFYRLGDELRRATPGTGLGLYIVKRLVELSGAHITATSGGPGRGARIALDWPLEQAP